MNADKPAPSARRGGHMNSVGHALQIVLVLALLTAAAVMLVWSYNVPGIVLLVAGGIIAFINRRA